MILSPGVRKSILVLLLGLFLTACSPVYGNDQRLVDVTQGIWLRSGEGSVGQTFVPHHGGLSGVDVWLAPGEATQGQVRFHLRDDPYSTIDIRTATLPVVEMGEAGFVRFSFEPISQSQNNYYYGFWELQEAEEGIEVGGGLGDAYLNGAAYEQHQPVEGQLAFTLVYTPTYAAWDLVKAVAQWGFWLILTFLAFVLPGQALLLLVAKGKPLPVGTWLGLGAGISLALYPVLMLWTDWAGVHLGSLYAWLPMALGAVVILLSRPWQGLRPGVIWKEWRTSGSIYPDVSLLILMAMVFAVRLVVIRTLDAPMWGDSQQHATIVQLMLDNGGLFRSWQPYTPFETFTVHFGFHSVTAVFAWLTGMGAVQSTLVMGQIVNGLAILTLYPLAERLWKGNRWAGVGAVLVGGLLSPMPAYYVNWGRYPQLMGQAILPVALWLVLQITVRKERVWWFAVLAGVVISGMTLAYYRMPFYFATFVLAWLVLLLFDRLRRPASWWPPVLSLSVAGVVAVVLFGPCITRAMAGSQLADKASTVLSLEFAWRSVISDYQIWRQIDTYVPRLLLVLSGFAVLFTAIRKQWAGLVIVGWSLALASVVAGRVINLPGASMMQSFAVIIALYIPVSVLVGGLMAQVAEVRLSHLVGPLSWTLCIGVLLAGMMGSKVQLSIVDNSHLMVTRPDVLAMDWIRNNVAQEAIFLVEGFTIYEGTSIVGADAGWWIPVMARRGNTMPPQYALVSEVSAEADYPGALVELVSALETAPMSSPEITALLCQLGVTHAFVGQRQGLVGAGVQQLYHVNELAGAGAFHEVYARDRVRIYAFDQALCLQ